MEEEKLEELEFIEQDQENEEVCPVCGSTAVVINGRCKTCYSCGYSLCSM